MAMAIIQGSSYKDYPPRSITAKTRAFEHALDIELMVLDMMDSLDMTKKELAERMGIRPSALSNLLNCQPNMTLETLARFELALDATFEFNLRSGEKAVFVGIEYGRQNLTCAFSEHADEVAIDANEAKTIGSKLECIRGLKSSVDKKYQKDSEQNSNGIGLAA